MAESGKQWEILGLPVTLPILIISVLAIVLIPFVISRILFQGTKTGPSSTFLLAGPRDAGKTSFSLYLQEKTLVPTQTSTTSASVNLSSSVLEAEEESKEAADENRPYFGLKDTPGHPKLRSLALGGISDPTIAFVGIIYMIDSAALSQQARLTDTVEYLYEILLAIQQRYSSITESSTTSTDPIPLMIACNKTDLFTSLPSAKISNLLQIELGRMKETKRKGLLNAGADEADDEDLGRVLGDENSDQITWDGMKDFGVEITVQSGSVKNAVVESWKTWMLDHLNI